ncbi:hypothetical protein [Alicyclobacillus fastidiosus]|uniref:hypothetical protein n=1 Tax=Alicyclobacillus fastidiosus TaxID=392011 RepID=UPI0024E0F4CC|nr:hypothetical protein [Alicyclobacillus fastidiosus]
MHRLPLKNAAADCPVAGEDAVAELAVDDACEAVPQPLASVAKVTAKTAPSAKRFTVKFILSLRPSVVFTAYGFGTNKSVRRASGGIGFPQHGPKAHTIRFRDITPFTRRRETEVSGRVE